MADYLNRAERAESQLGAAVQPSLMNDLSNCNDHARVILDTVRSLADTLHGSMPRDTANVKQTQEPGPTMRRHVDHLQQALNEIDQELRAIVNRL